MQKCLYPKKGLGKPEPLKPFMRLKTWFDVQRIVKHHTNGRTQMPSMILRIDCFYDAIEIALASPDEKTRVEALLKAFNFRRLFLMKSKWLFFTPSRVVSGGLCTWSPTYLLFLTKLRQMGIKYW
jgi:hypothetical protein